MHPFAVIRGPVIAIERLPQSRRVWVWDEAQSRDWYFSSSDPFPFAILPGHRLCLVALGDQLCGIRNDQTGEEQLYRQSLPYNPVPNGCTPVLLFLGMMLGLILSVVGLSSTQPGTATGLLLSGVIVGVFSWVLHRDQVSQSSESSRLHAEVEREVVRLLETPGDVHLSR